MKREGSDLAGGQVSIGALINEVFGDFDRSINSIKARQGGTYYTLYTPAGGKQTVELIPGQNWELMVYWSCVNNNKGLTGWSAGVSMVASASVPSTYREQFKGTRLETASSFSNMNFDMNMGAMPSSNVTINRVKFWATQQYTLQAPPSDQW